MRVASIVFGKKKTELKEYLLLIFIIDISVQKLTTLCKQQQQLHTSDFMHTLCYEVLVLTHMKIFN